MAVLTPTLDIVISLSTKLQFKLIILIYLDQICPKSIFSLKNRLNDRTIEFRILELD